MTVHREQSMKREKPTRCDNQMFIINFYLNMFRASLCPSSGEQRTCYCIWCILVWFCWMWLVAVVGRCLVGCEHTVLTSWNPLGLSRPVMGLLFFLPTDEPRVVRVVAASPLNVGNIHKPFVLLNRLF